MSKQLDQKIRIARKDHVCDYCGNAIKSGESYEWSKHIHDGTIFEWRNHLACGRVASAIWDYCDLDDGMDEEQFCDGCAEVCSRFVCPDCASWDDEYGECRNGKSFCVDKMDEFFKAHELYRAGREAFCGIWKCRQIEKEVEHD